MRLGVKWAVSSVAVVVLAIGGGSTTTAAVADVALQPPAASEAPLVGPAPPSTPEQDRRIAQNAVLRLDDLPFGWSTYDDDPPSTSQKTTGKCAGLKLGSATRTARADSGGFLVGRNRSFGRHTVNLFPDPERAVAVFERMIGRTERRCYAREIRRHALKTWAETVTATETSQFRVEMLGDRTAATRTTVWFTDADGPGVVIFDRVYTLIGRGLSLSQFTDIRAKRRTTFARAAALRLGNALTSQP
jgi:hypothetical protein